MSDSDFVRLHSGKEMFLVQFSFNSLRELELNLSRQNMTGVTKIFVILSLCLSCTRAYPLDKLVDVIKSEKMIETLIIVQHSQNKNCTLQHWNPRGIPVIRANELTSFKVRGIFNKELMTMVCIGAESESILLHTVAKLLENLRQERIILWTQAEPTKRFQTNVATQSKELKFIQILILTTGNQPSGIKSMYVLNPFPTARFVQVENMSRIANPVFLNRAFGYSGITAIVKDSSISASKLVKTTTGAFPISRLEDMEIIEFARKYNLSLKLFKENSSNRDQFDIISSPQFITLANISAVDFVNPSSTSSLTILVPCCNKLNFKDFLRKLGVQSWFLYLLPVYATFVLVETLVLLVTNRMTGQPYRLPNLNALLNLRAFRAILGLSYPELRRTSLSLRQLSLAITIFGLIFSNFFSCNLSAVLTKPLEQPGVRNFKELRDSGMTTVTTEYVQSFIEKEIDPQFFHQVVPKLLIMTPSARLELIFSLNDTYSYIMYTQNWLLFDTFQRSMGKKVFCSSNDLTIVRNLPRMYVMENNSIFKWMLSRFVIYIQEAGIIEHWKKDITQLMKKTFNITVRRNIESDVIPISLQQLTWLLQLLAMGYGLATVVFIVEIYLRKR